MKTFVVTYAPFGRPDDKLSDTVEAATQLEAIVAAKVNLRQAGDYATNYRGFAAKEAPNG